jgi:hypothetical protein
MKEKDAGARRATVPGGNRLQEACNPGDKQKGR